MMAMSQNQDYHALDLDKNDGKYNTVATIVKCGLSDRLVGGITQSKFQYRSKIGHEGGGGTPPPPPWSRSWRPIHIC